MDLIKKRLSKTRIIGRVIARLPFVSCVILNGSLASGTSKQSSDIDILIIAKDDRIFTARFFVILFATIFRIKRSNKEVPIRENQCKRSVSVRSKSDARGHAGKFCFNYFLTEDYLRINYPKEREEYCADNYFRSKFIAGNEELFNRFMETNKDLFEKFNCHPALDAGSRKLSSRFLISSLQSGMTAWAQRLWESVFTDWFERWAKKYQINKIESDFRTKKYPESIVYNDRELRFHPPKVGSK